MTPAEAYWGDESLRTEARIPVVCSILVSGNDRHLHDVMGKSAARDIDRGTPLAWDLVGR